MGQISIANSKGGCSKTGVAVQLVDHDVQRSSLDWAADRPLVGAHIEIKVSAGDASLQCDASDIIIHDMPAAWTY